VEHVNESSGSIRVEEFLDYLSYYQILNKDPFTAIHIFLLL
jgi:hypothetical protein